MSDHRSMADDGRRGRGMRWFAVAMVGLAAIGAAGCARRDGSAVVTDDGTIEFRSYHLHRDRLAPERSDQVLRWLVDAKPGDAVAPLYALLLGDRDDTKPPREPAMLFDDRIDAATGICVCIDHGHVWGVRRYATGRDVRE
jgi:hypothetical protein